MTPSPSPSASPRTVQGVFLDAEQEYTRASDAWRTAAETLRGAQGQLRETEREIHYAEAVVRLTADLKGKTADARTAELAVAARDDAEHQKLLHAGEGHRQAVARWGDECTAARDAMAKAKRVMDFSTALLTFKATQGGEHGNRR